MADGDCTYDASVARNLVDKLLLENLDMVVGCRVDQGEAENYRRGHRFGNQMLTRSGTAYFRRPVHRYVIGLQSVFAGVFVKSFPALSRGFQIEPELTVMRSNCVCPVVRSRRPTAPARWNRNKEAFHLP